VRALSIALAAFFATLACAAPARDLPATVRQALARANVPLDAVSAIVEPVERGGALVAHLPAEPRNPASVMKLVTTYAALELLGPAFTFHTDALAAGGLAGGVLDGNLWLRGGGDPN